MSCDILFLRTSFTCLLCIYYQCEWTLCKIQLFSQHNNIVINCTVKKIIPFSWKGDSTSNLTKYRIQKWYVWIFVETLIFCCDFMAVSVSRRLCPEQSGRRILQHFIAGPGGAKFNYRLLHNCVYLQQLLLILFCICTWVTFNSLIFFFLEPFKVKYSNFKIQN